MRSFRRGNWVLFAGLLSVPPPATADEEGAPAPVSARLQVGQEAPPVHASTWLNTKDGADPLAGVTGKVVMVEFWGTWCGPCVRSMPHVEAMFERYGPRGLVVVALTREAPDKVKPFLAKNAYQMPVGCDPEQTCISTYHLNGWPSTYLIDKDGKIAYVGAPYSVEGAIEKALGLETSPSTQLTAYLDATGGKDAKAVRDALERLVEKAPTVFDTTAWALGVLGHDPAETPSPPKVDRAKALDAVVSAWKAGDSEKKRVALEPLALAGPKDFDLGTWAKAIHAKAYPLLADEVKSALAAKRYESLLDALIDRAPSPALLAQAMKDDAFLDWCRSKSPDARADPRRGLMGVNYMFVEAPPKGLDWEAFSKDLSVSGMAFDREHKHVIGLLIGGATVMKEAMPGYVHRQLSRFTMMGSLVDEKPLRGAAIGAAAAKEEQRIVDALKRKYG